MMMQVLRGAKLVSPLHLLHEESKGEIKLRPYGAGHLRKGEHKVRPYMSAISFQLARLRGALRPFRLHWFPTLRSTNDHAAALRKRGDLYAPAVVLTGRQTAGRGRGEHTWWSGPGCLTLTFVLPAGEIEPHRVPLLAGLAVRNAAAELSGSDAIRLKWPNDVLLGDGRGFRKLAGLLCERVVNADLVGLGLNVNLDPARAPRALRGRVASLAQAAKRPIDMTDALVTVAIHLRQTLDRATKEPFAAILREYDGHHALVGKTVSVIVPGGPAPLSGRCEGLDEMGRLLLRSRSTVHRVIAGQVVLRDP
jgi:BirA family biotin operon repressor/biotin-[acetyl-CoA-carboxylase] ligase